MSSAIEQLIAVEYETLLQAFTLYVRRAGLQNHLSPQELLNEVSVEALVHVERFAEVREPVAWLIGIGLNIIQRHHVYQAKQLQREPLVRDLYPNLAERLSDGELFDLLDTLTSPDPALLYEQQALVHNWLSLVNPADRKIIELTVIQDLDSATVAEKLGISAGAVRMRLHRALKRLRTAMLEVNNHE